MDGVSVNEERLLEIASAITQLDGPLVVLGYLISMAESDMYLFFKHIQGSKYKNLDFYVAIKNFSQDYVSKRNEKNVEQELEKFGYKNGNYDEFFKNYKFSDNYTAEFLGLDTFENGRSR